MNDKMSRQTVLVVDDASNNIAIFSNILSPKYRVKAAKNGSKALQIAFETIPDIILLDIMMPEMDGYEVCRKLKQDPRTRNIPIIFVTAMVNVEDEAHGFEIGAVDYITKPVSPPIVLARVKTHLQLYDQNRSLEEKVRRRTTELDNSRREIIRRLGRAAEYKDNETGMHVIRMSYYSHIIAKGIGMNEVETDLILNATPMHDIGKIGIPDIILLKAGKLDEHERKIIQKHCEFGAEIIGKHDNPLLQMAYSVALTHHEKWNGKGYPHGLKGEDIPLEGRIVAIADVFDALTSERTYKKAWPVEKAVALILEESGQHFDPALVTVFMDNLESILEVKDQHAEKE
ncbi:putative two-component system response regulator [Maridesulfovibrio ferrireducens]|uniref:Putative two-component system response regulator n=1 Tax=Maridesulfovibrio ferrireducens TaxID=246191 RepID=A0A1G9B8N4_9BACT|nr:two-component system response regulator [Maridesulfovibrio ferrireducens]SDK35843.1 putative two-component system response regulator [Maridesulfovibrio ferrireducens]